MKEALTEGLDVATVNITKAELWEYAPPREIVCMRPTKYSKPDR